MNYLFILLYFNSKINKQQQKYKNVNMDVKLGKQFRITRKLGEGAFGQIYHAINVKNNMEVAVKLEAVSTKHPQLFYEVKLY